MQILTRVSVAIVTPKIGTGKPNITIDHKETMAGLERNPIKYGLTASTTQHYM